jgi:hypothetical protein
MRRLSLLCAVLAGCGGAVEDSAPSPAPATNAPNSVAAGDGCTRACDRMTSTCRAYEDARCAESCASSFDTDEQAATFAACIDALSCEDIVRGVSMDYGPIGECWSRARGR